MAFLMEKTFHILRNLQVRQRQARAFAKWQRGGCPNPPPHLIKQQVLREYAQQYGLEILVETGTYRGDMVQAMKNSFKKVYSIELSDRLFEAARRRFHGQEKVEIIHGDSGIELAKLIPRLDRPTLFWLDGHYSAGITARGATDTPIFEELDHIFNSAMKNYAIVIDDARLFGADPGYPTMEQLRQFINGKLPGGGIRVDSDSIRVTLKPAARAVA
jgi:hypothetical protein